MFQCTVIDYLAKRTFAISVFQCTVIDYLAKRTFASTVRGYLGKCVSVYSDRLPG